MAQFPSTSSASDVWNVTDIYRAVAGGNWPSPPAPAIPDPYFPYVTMLLPGNGTNGAQNNTFLDSGPNTYTITRSGNTTQGTFSPYGSNWSTFVKEGAYLSVPNNAVFNPGSGDFTVEAMFVRTNNTGGSQTIIAKYETGWQASYSIVIAGNTWDVYITYGVGSYALVYSGAAPAVGVWSHVALQRSGAYWEFYCNGVRLAQVTAYTIASTTSAIRIGELGAGYSGYSFYGNISNVRIRNGYATYSGSTYTVPTANLTAITGTVLLTCQSNRFIDNSSNNFTVTAGTVSTALPSVQRFSPFSPTATYSTSVIGGSGYFDGSGDNLVTSGAGSFNPRSAFTVEFWTYPITNTTVTWINSNTNDNFYIETFSGTLYVGDGSINTISTTPPALNCWTHVLLSFDGTTYRLFYNGVAQATSTTLLASITLTAFRVGQKNDTSRPFSGYINDMRVLVGTALYTSAFTPPTAPLTAISNTVLLLSYTNAGIIDNAMMNNLETVGNVQISTSVSKFGGGSIAFDGAGDILKIPPDVNVNMNFDTGPFTFECWVYRNSASGQIFIADFGVTSANGWALYDEGATGNMQVRIADVDRIAVSPIPVTTWTHLAVVRVGTTITLYVNGTSAGSYASAGTNLIYAGTKYIGSQSGSSSYMNGYMDDIRITKGYARYTANFTPPTEAFPTF